MNYRRRGIFYPTHPPQVCCLSEHSGMLEFAFLHTRMPVAENEVKSIMQELIQSSGTSSSFAAVHEGAVLQSEYLVLTRSFRLLLVILPHGNGPRQGKIPNQVRQQGGDLPPREEELGNASQDAFILLALSKLFRFLFSRVHKEQMNQPTTQLR